MATPDLTASDAPPARNTPHARSFAASWEDRYWWSADGLRLHYRYYAGPNSAAKVADAGADVSENCPILCLPGLTRNARDFEDLAPRLAAYQPVLSLNFRGRGDSAYAKDPMSYVPLTYVQDVIRLIDDLALTQVAIVGTSLGGIVVMLLGASQPGRVRAIVLNDIGPDIDPTGLARIKNYVGVSAAQPTWIHAARAIMETGGAIYPDFGLEDWLRMVKRSHRLSPEGRIVADYDRRIAEPFRIPGNEAGIDLWPAYAALATLDVLIIRGGTSDILASDTAQKMAALHANAHLVTVPGVGHAPSLDEPAAVDAILAWAAALQRG